jgi:mobilome CxxCx(11)CxxC protein
MAEENLYDKLRIKCHDNAFHCFGHQYIFDRRAQYFSKVVNLLKVLGVLVPAAIGATALGYGIDSNILKAAIAIAIPLTILQFIVSTIAIIYKWDDELSYSFEASQHYNTLYREFKKLGEFPPSDYDALNTSYDLIDTQYNSRDQQDSKHNIKEWQLRRGMRFSLREFQRTCKGCGKTPISMESTDCPVCGNYLLKNKMFNL